MGHESMSRIILWLSVLSVLLLMTGTLSTTCFAQNYYNSNVYSGKLYGGKPLNRNQYTLGNIRLNQYQPTYGGKAINPADLYNPYLEEAFSLMGKPLYSPNPYVFPNLNMPNYYDLQPDTSMEPSNPEYYPEYVPTYPIVPRYPIRVDKGKVKSEDKKKQEVAPIIPALIASIDTLSKKAEKDDTKSGKTTKWLKLNGWSGRINFDSDNYGQIRISHYKGETVTGSFSKQGDTIYCNFSHYGKEGSQNWNSRIQQRYSSGHIRLDSGSVKINGYTTKSGTSNRYNFNYNSSKYEVEIRETGSNSASIHVRTSDYNSLTGTMY